MRRKFLRFGRSDSGSVIIEFAVISPVFFYLIFAIFEVFTLMLSEGVLESAVRQAARSGLTGYTPVGMTRDEYILSEIEAEAILLNADNISIETLVYSNFGDIGQSEPYTDTNGDGYYDIGEPYTDSNGNGQWDEDMGLAGKGNGGDIVVYRVSYPWTFMTPFMGEFFFEDGTYTITTSAVVRNEPF